MTTKKEKQDELLLVGAHTSAAGGVHHALLYGQEIGATTIQLFTSNQKQWKGKPISEKEVGLWEKALEETGIQKVMCHDSYLINLGSPKPELSEKSLKAFEEEIERCFQLKLSYLNFHPGAATTDTTEKCLDKIVKNLLSCAPLLEKSDLRLLIETTAGQGTSVGHQFEQLAYIIEHVKDKVPIGVCIDTCHIFAAGYDIRTKAAWDHTLKDFDKIIGLKHLYALHVNDSQKPFGSKRDRHASLGAGEIGMECFKVIMQDPRLKYIPKYLETPFGDKMWKDEIALLKKFGKGK